MMSLLRERNRYDYQKYPDCILNELPDEFVFIVQMLLLNDISTLPFHVDGHDMMVVILYTVFPICAV
jgi:hypothetical protein